MRPWNRNICNPDLTLVSPTYFYRSIFFSGYYVQAALLPRLHDPICQTFKDYVRLVGFVDCHHFDVLPCNTDNPRKRWLTNFTLKFCKIVRGGYIANVFFYLTTNPLSQTTNMNFLTTSFTQAWRNKGILLRLLVAKTHFTVNFILVWLGSLKNSTCFIKMMGISNGQCFFVSFHLYDHILNPSHFDDISRF